MTEIVQTLRCEIVKPLDGDWDGLGRVLRALSAPLHRVLNGVVADVELSKRAGDDVHPRTLAYRRARDLWAAERAAASERVANKKLYSGDEAIAELEPGSSLVLGVAGAAYARWAKFDKERWKGTMSLPSFRNHSPLYVASAGVEIAATDGLAVLTLQLLGGRGVARRRVVVRPYGGQGFGAMRKLLENPESIGDVRLVYERHDGRRKWQALIAHTIDAPTLAEGRTMALHRGVACFLTAVVAGGKGREPYATVLETGDDVLRHKARYGARRRSLGKQGRQLGKGAKGRGVARRHERITRIEDAEARWVRTKCQEVAAHAIRLAEHKGVSRILIEDWTNPAADGAPELGAHVEYMVRSFPLAQLRECIEWAGKKRGFAVEVVCTDYDSCTCPVCAHVHDVQPVDTYRLFRCVKCTFERNVDLIAALNMLRRDGQPSPVKGLINRSKRAAGRLRKAK